MPHLIEHPLFLWPCRFVFGETQFVQVNNQQISAFVTAGNVKFMLLHGGKNEESIRMFFHEVYELYVKVRHFKQAL